MRENPERGIVVGADSLHRVKKAEGDERYGKFVFHLPGARPRACTQRQSRERWRGCCPSQRNGEAVTCKARVRYRAMASRTTSYYQ